MYKRQILDYLGDLEVQTLLVEGGLETWKRFLEEKLVDSAHLCISDIELDAENEDFFFKSHLENAGLILKNEPGFRSNLSKENLCTYLSESTSAIALWTPSNQIL